MNSVAIETRKLGWFRRVEIETPKGIHTFNEIRGKILVPAARADQIGISVHDVKRMFQTGELTCYKVNGQIKRGTSSQKTYFDLNQWSRI